jgi:hypothetical protein
MQTINFAKGLSFEQIALFIATCPEIRVHVEGEPGIGKSSMLPIIARRAGIKRWAYIDTPSLDVGDARMPVLKHDTKTTGFYPNEWFQLHTGEPVIIMLDEFSKGADPVKNMLHPLLEVVNSRLGDVPAPPGSPIFMTGNLSSDGVGDGLKAHTKMRITLLEISKPTAKEWLVWAVENAIAPVVMAWVDRNPHALASYRDGDQQGNQYIFMPNTVQGAVVTPRTLELASNIIKMRSSFDHAALQAALTGTVGAPAANSIAAFIAHQDSLPSWKDIIEQPHRTPIPTEQGAWAVLVFGAIERVERSSLPQFLDYISRAEEEWQTIFCLGLARSKTKQPMAFTCKAFSDWIVKNEDLL